MSRTASIPVSAEEEKPSEIKKTVTSCKRVRGVSVKWMHPDKFMESQGEGSEPSLKLQRVLTFGEDKIIMHQQGGNSSRDEESAQTQQAMIASASGS